MMKNPYEILGVLPDASKFEIKSSFKRLAKTTHPDSNTRNNNLADSFAEIAKAYTILSNPKSKEQFDTRSIRGTLLEEISNMEDIEVTAKEIEEEVMALQDMGHKRLALEVGEDPKINPIEYILESIETIYKIKHKNGAIRRVNVNIAATVENYKKLKEAEIGTYILFQETYHKDSYEKLHPSGPKHNYSYHTEAMDRAMEAGIDDVGVGVL